MNFSCWASNICSTFDTYKYTHCILNKS
jgi:hypothetical protein